MSKPPELYGRVWSITVTDGFKSYTWNQIQCSFNIVKTNDLNPNEADLKLINLNAESRQFLSSPGLKLIIKAGYTALNGQIFTGNVETITHKRDQGQWVTTIAAKDGGAAKRNILISEPIDKKTPAEQVIKRIIKKITGEGVQKVQVKGLEPVQEGTITVTPSPTAPAETPKTQQTNRRTTKSKAERQKEAELKRQRAAQDKANQATVNLSVTVGKTKIIRGNAFDLLKSVCDSVGLEAVMLDNKINVSPKEKPLTNTISVLDKTSGLIGVPELLEKGWTFTSLLRSDMAPGQLVRVSSNIVSGNYLIFRLEYTGDSAGQEWYSKIEGVRI